MARAASFLAPSTSPTNAFAQARIPRAATSVSCTRLTSVPFTDGCNASAAYSCSRASMNLALQKLVVPSARSASLFSEVSLARVAISSMSVARSRARSYSASPTATCHWPRTVRNSRSARPDARHSARALAKTSPTLLSAQPLVAISIAPRPSCSSICTLVFSAPSGHCVNRLKALRNAFSASPVAAAAAAMRPDCR